MIGCRPARHSPRTFPCAVTTVAISTHRRSIATSNSVVGYIDDAITAAACELAEEVRAGRLKIQAATLELSRRFPGLDGPTAMQTMGLGLAATR